MYPEIQRNCEIRLFFDYKKKLQNEKNKIGSLNDCNSKKKKEKKKNGIIVFLNKYKNFVALFFFVELNLKK